MPANFGWWRALRRGFTNATGLSRLPRPKEVRQSGRTEDRGTNLDADWRVHSETVAGLAHPVGPAGAEALAGGLSRPPAGERWGADVRRAAFGCASPARSLA